MSQPMSDWYCRNVPKDDIRYNLSFHSVMEQYTYHLLPLELGNIFTSRIPVDNLRQPIYHKHIEQFCQDSLK